MKKIISVLMILAITLGLLSGCVVRKTGSGAAVEGLTPELSGELSFEYPIDETAENTYEVLNGPYKAVTEKETSYPQFKGISSFYKAMLPYYSISGFDINSYNTDDYGIPGSNNIVMAKILEAQRISIGEKYYLKYKYQIEKTYRGSLKKGAVIEAFCPDLMRDGYLCGNNYPTQEISKQQTYPKAGQYIVTKINKFDLDEKYNSKYGKVSREYVKSLYKEEKRLLRKCYKIEASADTQFLLDNDKKIISYGEVPLLVFRKYKNNPMAEIETIEDIDYIVEILVNNAV